jgi:hypothetical protein
VQPLYYAAGGMNVFASQLRDSVGTIKPWADWDVVMLDPESKVRFYLQLPPTVRNYSVLGDSRQVQSQASLLAAWPVLREKHSAVIFVTRKSYEAALRNILPGFMVVESPLTLGERVLKIRNPNAPVAFVSRS